MGQHIGYQRVSTVDQNTDRQLDGVELDKVFTDKASGKDTKRPELERALEYVRHELITDLQTSYEIQQGPLKGVMFLFQVNNLTNTPFIDYSADPGRVRDYETFGRDMFFGANYKF